MTQTPVSVYGAERIVLVDDNPALREVIREMLEEEGYVVLEASDPASARDAAVGADLLLTDMHLPGTSGREIAAVVRAVRPSIGVLFMSGSDETEPVGDLGDEPFIQKPFGAMALLTKVRGVLDARPLG